MDKKHADVIKAASYSANIAMINAGKSVPKSPLGDDRMSAYENRVRMLWKELFRRKQHKIR